MALVLVFFGDFFGVRFFSFSPGFAIEFARRNGERKFANGAFGACIKSRSVKRPCCVLVVVVFVGLGFALTPPFPPFISSLRYVPFTPRNIVGSFAHALELMVWRLVGPPKSLRDFKWLLGAPIVAGTLKSHVT